MKEFSRLHDPRLPRLTTNVLPGPTDAPDPGSRVPDSRFIAVLLWGPTCLFGPGGGVLVHFPQQLSVPAPATTAPTAAPTTWHLPASGRHGPLRATESCLTCSGSLSPWVSSDKLTALCPAWGKHHLHRSFWKAIVGKTEHVPLLSRSQGPMGAWRPLREATTSLAPRGLYGIAGWGDIPGPRPGVLRRHSEVNGEGPAGTWQELHTHRFPPASVWGRVFKLLVMFSQRKTWS